MPSSGNAPTEEKKEKIKKKENRRRRISSGKKNPSAAIFYLSDRKLCHFLSNKTLRGNTPPCENKILFSYFYDRTGRFALPVFQSNGISWIVTDHGKMFGEIDIIDHVGIFQ